MNQSASHTLLTLIGFGEAGQTFAKGSLWAGSARGYDIDPTRKIAMAEHGIRPGATAAEALSRTPLVLSLVTADQALIAARDYARHLAAGAIWCDMNSVAPETKRSAAQAIEAAGGRYVDVAVLAPVEPARLAVPLLLSGPAAREAARALGEAGFTNISMVGTEIGRASTIKMVRSIMVKGIEALTGEMMAAADAAGVTREVLASLDASAREESWQTRAAYNLERMATHGNRRAAEMEEVAKTLAALDIEPAMTCATIALQRAAADGASSEIGKGDAE